jgi:hypothetical protein
MFSDAEAQLLQPVAIAERTSQGDRVRQAIHVVARKLAREAH